MQNHDLQPKLTKPELRQPELLAPCGSPACLKMAVAAGCDAIYFGGHAFNARAGAGNFNLEEMAEAVRYCRLHGVKTFLTVNTIVKESEFKDFEAAFREMASTGITGVIVQDMGVASYIGENYPEIELHASTQMSVHSLDGVRFLEERGFTRVVLARELSLEEVEHIRRHTSVELEVFIHGALCYSVSGQCLLSSMIGGRSGNRGMCAQPCRLPYHAEGQEAGYLMNLKDMCSLRLIPELSRIGVNSLKIEGRLKSPEYVYGVTSAYRKMLDGQLDPQDLEEEKRRMAQLFNRGGFSEGYWTRNHSMIEKGSPKHQGLRIGKVESIKKGRIYLRTEEELHPKDVLEIRTEQAPYPSYQLQSRNIDPENPYSCWITAQTKVRSGQAVYRLQDAKLMEEYAGAAEPRIPLEARLILRKGEKACLQLKGPGQKPFFSQTEGETVQASTGGGLTEETLRRQLGKTGGSPFIFTRIELDVEEGCFLPVSAINALRRLALEKHAGILENESLRHPRPYQKKETKPRASMRGRLEIEISTLAQWKAVKENAPDATVFFRTETMAPADLVRSLKEAQALGITPGLSLEHYTTEREKERDLDLLAQLGDLKPTLLVHHSGQLLLSDPCEKVLGSTVPVTNRKSQAFWRTAAEEVTASVELGAREAAQLDDEDTAVLAYGRIPVMITRQCLKRESSGCLKPNVPDSPYLFSLYDRKDQPWLVEVHCRSCYNIIYMNEPLYMGDRLKALQGKKLRLSFLNETAEETSEVLALFQQALSGDVPAEPSFPFTRGHYYKPCF